MSPVMMGLVPFEEYVRALTPDERREFEGFVNEQRERIHHDQRSWAAALGHDTPDAPALFHICEDGEA